MVVPWSKRVSPDSRGLYHVIHFDKNWKARGRVPPFCALIEAAAPLRMLPYTLRQGSTLSLTLKGISLMAQ